VVRRLRALPAAFSPLFLLLLLLLLALPAEAEEDRTVAEADVESRRVAHLLRRATFGPRLEDVAEVRRLGRKDWIERQLQPEQIPDRDVEERLARFDTLGLSPTDYWAMLEERRPPPRVPGRGESRLDEARKRQQAVNRLRTLAQREVPASVLLRAVYSRRQLQEVMLEFWRNHFNVDVNKNDVRYYLPDWERTVLRSHALGSFEDLLLASARHPAMLYYLDNHVSQAPMARGEKVLSGREREERTDGLNENYARELMELHTVGVDNGYDQDDVIQLALVLTGWSIGNRGEERGAFLFRDRYHAKGRKKVMGKTVRNEGVEEGEAILRYLARHANTREFLCTKLVRYLAADDPPRVLVEAAIKTWKKTKGDLREVVRTILEHDAFYEAPCVLTKARTPFEFVASSLRAVRADVQDAGVVLGRLADLDQPVYQCEDPTGYSDAAADWMDPGVFAVRWRFAYDLVHGRLRGVKIDASPVFRHIRQSPEVWEQLLVDEVCAGRTPAVSTMAPFRQRIDLLRRDFARMKPADRLRHFRILVALLLGAPEFQRQ
jgi:uncharacterized protein (DUF1800 family)